MRDDFDDDEFEKSVMNIVDEETADAQMYVKKNFNTEVTDFDSINSDDEKQQDISESENDKPKDTGKKGAVIIAVVVVLIIAAGVASFFVIRTAIAKSKDNYAYYNSIGYEALDNKDYEKAIAGFEKALTYEEGQTNDTTNINMMLYLYDCYVAVKNEDKAMNILKEVIRRDPLNKSAHYYLIEMYASRKDYDSIHNLYLAVKDSGDKELILYFNDYLAQVPSVTPAGGTYQADQEITLSAPEGYKIYYTDDGSNPTESASLYTGKIQITEGNTVLKYYAVNEFGFESDVVEADYKIEYTGPVKPMITPSNTEISQEEKAKVVISGVQAGSQIYYTLDGSKATTGSTLYTGPFELPAGKVTVSVLVVDTHGKTTTASKTYNVRYKAKYTDAEAAEFVWNALIANSIVNDEHMDAGGRLCELKYYSSKLIENKNIYLFYYNVDGVMQSFYYGADGDTGDVYTVTAVGNNFAITPLQ